MSKEAFIVRYGAFGDCIMITPALTRLKELGYHVTLNTTKRGMEVFKHDDRVDKIIEHDDSIPLEKIKEFWKKQKKKIKSDIYINFSESLECNVALHPIQPAYNYPKYERKERCNRNYYDVTNEWSKLDNCGKVPSLQFTDEEHDVAKQYIKEGKFNILWGMSGSGRNKVYPWTDFVMGEVLKNHKDIHFITVGDERCKLLETYNQEDIITHISGDIPFRVSMLLTKYVDLVISPDTGLLHASGCFSTPKIGLLGHTTIENITKHFVNDYSLEANCSCAPCFRLIYDYEVQCPIDIVTRAAWCMAFGIKPERINEQINRVIKKARR